MVKAKNGVIVINRGDTCHFTFTVPIGTIKDSQYILQGDDALYFGLMDPGQPFEYALVRKRYDKEDLDENGNIVITINHEDTVDLLPGKYFYAIKLHECHDDIDQVVTVVNKTKFIICD